MAGEKKTKLLREAEKCVLQGKIPRAIAEYLKITKIDPDDVLTLNIIGDLHLRLGKTAEANKYFSHVAENYARNNFLLKAIAVYKKILSADPANLEVNRTLASLYEKQGMNLYARNQYLQLAAIYEREGKARESQEAYEKVAEMDPQNYAVQLRLAEINLTEGSKERAQAYFAAAARAQSKMRDLSGAVSSFKRALELNPVDLDSVRGFLQTCIRSGDVAPALEQLKKTLLVAPDDLSLHEMLGQACVAAGDPEQALGEFELVLSRDESRYTNFLSVSKAFLEAGNLGRASSSLDPIIPILIAKRETASAIDAYAQVLKSNATHIATLTRLARIYASANDRTNYLEVLDKSAGYYLGCGSPREALEYLDKILSIEPANEKYLRLHREAFAQAFPEIPYVPPVATSEPVRRSEMPSTILDNREEAVVNPAIVEVDLLLNYGMRDKAAAMLQSLESRDPADLEIRTRLLDLYKENNNRDKAAEECILLAALHRGSKNEDAAQKFLAEARALNPELVGPQFDLGAFARSHGLAVDIPETKTGPISNMEVDLSGDLSEIFFKESSEADTHEEDATPAEVKASDFVPDAPPKVPPKSVQEQIQEVDFYLKLGFFAEARAKLDEISRNFPGAPELPSRYQRLSEAGVAAAIAPEAPSGVEVPAAQPDQADLFQEEEGTGVAQVATDHPNEEVPADRLTASEPQTAGLLPESESSQPRAGETAGASADSTEAAGGHVNEMFADLLEEVNTLTDKEIAREEFDTHFSLGIAYREMGLIDDAIKEFQSAYKVVNSEKLPKEAIQCCAMLSTCFVEKGMPRSAIRWCHEGLAIPGISPHEALALKYEAGVAHSTLGDREQALECFDHVYRADPGFRDVAQKLDSLRGGPDRHAP